ncbi:ribosomal protein S18-alanine N-acetyltransferase [Pueribacillus sp. YX66]|uniref:ribosomal protein S18-alanine N-acetyltransferase n=1 Tax=Pueribacillus sp. YX66 TaxID=3229242 RepID=UPI00358D9292
MKNRVEFRYMTVEDIDAVLAVDCQSFPNPWSKETFYQEMMYNDYALYLLMEYNGEIIGYSGMWIITDEAHITNIAVLPEYRGQKLGEALFEKTIEVAKSYDAMTMTLEVRVSNQVAQNLYEKFGFQIGGLRKRYYTDNKEDAYVMWVRFSEHEAKR